ncbi:MAG: hypothetical protein HGA29_05230, partial [Syntrophaceae bacterium]|nr:hypothetical protein [Syntrophaceae bacterium]
AWSRAIQSSRDKIRQMEIHLGHQSPTGTISEKRFLLNNYQKDILNNYNSMMTARKEQLHKNLALLNSLSPLNVLERGYSITRSLVNGRIIREAAQLEYGQAVTVKLAKGNFQAKVEKIFLE